MEIGVQEELRRLRLELSLLKTKNSSGTSGDHTKLSNIGVNTHPQIDAFIGTTTHTLANVDTRLKNKYNLIGGNPTTDNVVLVGANGTLVDSGHPLSGTVGPQGPKGDKGIDGAQGPKGDKGIDGAQGPKGDKGIDGAKGADSTVAGPKGDKGIDGAQGPKGTDGATGPQGPKGDKGIDGAQGPKGDQGAAGTGVSIKGSDTRDNIIAKSGKEGDMWLITSSGADHGHGLVSDGGGSGASHWVDVGAIQGPKGDQGTKGDTGAPGPQGSPGADSTVAGPQGVAGVQGIQGVPGHDGQPGVDGKDGDPLQLASIAETAAGQISDKANTPFGTMSAYVSKAKGGSFDAVVQFNKTPIIQYEGVSKKAYIYFNGGVNLGGFGYDGAAKGMVIRNGTATSSWLLADDNNIYFTTKAGAGAIRFTGHANFTEEATFSKAIVATGKVHANGGIKTTGAIVGQRGTAHTTDWIMGRAGKLCYLYNAVGTNYIDVNDSGDINLTPKAGSHAKVSGKNILTGTLTGTTLHLDF